MAEVRLTGKMLLAGVSGMGAGMVIGFRTYTVRGERLILCCVGGKKLFPAVHGVFKGSKSLGISGMSVQIQGKIIDCEAYLIDLL